MGEAKRRKLLDPNYGKASNELEFISYGFIKDIPHLKDLVRNASELSKLQWYSYVAFQRKGLANTFGCVLYTKDLKSEAIISLDVEGSCESVWGFSESQIFDGAKSFRQDLIKASVRKAYNLKDDQVILFHPS